MRENFYDNVLNGTEEWITNVSNNIAKEFRNAKPFDKEKIENEKMLSAYLTLQPQDMDYLLSKHPRDVVQDFIFDMEKLKSGRQENG
jgi:hypothetical protein